MANAEHNSTLSSRGVWDKSYQNLGNPRVLSMVPSSARIVLDVGCGAGDNASILYKNGLTIDGITLSSAEADHAKPYCRQLFVHNLEQGLPEISNDLYDIVLCSHVLEHICFPTRLLNDLHRVLKPEGTLIIALPNIMWWKTRLRIALGHFDYQESGIMDNTHFRWYTFRSAQRLLKDHRFSVQSANAYGAFPLGPLRRILPGSVSRSLDRGLSKLLPGLIGYEMIFTAKIAT